MMVKKNLTRVALALALTALSCDKVTAPPTTGSIAIVLLSEGGTAVAIADRDNSSAASLVGDGPANILLDGVRVTVAGPTNRTVTNSSPSGGFFNVSVADLAPGSYTVTVEGLVGGKVAHYGQTQNVSVTAGQTAQAAVTFPTFKPTLGVPSGTTEDTVEVLRFTVTFNAVTNATSYLVKWSTAQDMSNAQSKSITTTTTDVDVTAEGTYYYTVTAENATVGTSGLPSDPRPVNVIQAVATVTVTPGTPTIAYGATQQFSAEAKDALGATVPNVTWFWASSNHTVATVNQSGLVTSVGPGDATITAVGKGTPGSAALTVSQPAGTKLTFTAQPTTTVAGATMTSVKVAVQNVLNQTVTSDNSTQITLAIGTNAGGGTLTGGGTVTVVAGVATFNFVNINKTGVGYTLTASSGSLTAATSAEFTITPGAASVLAFSTQPPNGVLGDALSPALQVEIRDGLGNVVTSARNEVTLAIGTNPSSATLTGVNKVSAVNGVATFSNIALDKGGTGYTLSASATGFTAVASSAFDIAASGPAIRLAFATQPRDAVSSQNISPAVTVELKDDKGRTVSGDNSTQVTIAIGNNAGGGTLVGGGAVTVSGGVATYSGMNIDKAASGYTLSATATGLTGATSNSFAINPGAPSQLAFSVQPAASIAGDALSPAVQVELRDAAGNRVTSARDAVTIAIAVNPGAGTLTGTKTVNAIDGVASFTGVWINKSANGYRLAAAAPGVTGALSSLFNISPAAPAKLAFSQQPATNVQGNAVFAPAVTVIITDQFDNPTTATNNVTLSLANNPWKTPFSPGGTLSGTLTVAANNGTATFSNVKVDKPSPGYTFGAASGTLSGAASSEFNVKVTVQNDTSPRTKLSGGSYHTCAVMVGGSTYCWGANWYNQLGAVTGNTSSDSIAALVRDGAKPAAQNFVAVATGYGHSCGITADSTAYCWGYNGYGQLGNGSTTDSDVPVLVSGGLKFRAIIASAYHTCGLTGVNNAVIAQNRQVYCWGNNNSGQLGDSSNTSRNVPTRVNWPDAVKKSGGVATNPDTGVKVLNVATGGDFSGHTCARTIDNKAYCWGNGGSGQLGDATSVSKNGPALVSGALSWTAITTGTNHTCGIAAAQVRCWGDNGQGQLGDGTVASRNTPASQPAITVGAIAVTAGYYHNCAIISGGAAFCWGYNGNGQLGDGTFTSTNASPAVAVSGSHVFTSIKAGWFHTCGTTSAAGTPTFCWGYNGYGQLGSPGSGSNKNQPTQIIQ